MADIALAAVRPLLGLIQKEAQQLRGVRRDVHFIKNEMESMNAFLLNLAEARAQAGYDRQVVAWAAQVTDLAYDSTNCIHDYAESGRARARTLLVGRLRRLVWLPKRYLARRRIAARLRKLKVRAREIGERQKRYAVAAPLLPKEDAEGAARRSPQAGPVGAGGRDPDWLTRPEIDADRRAILAGPDILTEGAKEVIGWLKEKPGTEEEPWPRVIAIQSPDGNDEAAALAKSIMSLGASGFHTTTHVAIRRPVPDDFRLYVRRQLLPDWAFQICRKDGELLKTPEPLKHKKLLAVISGLEYPEEWEMIKMDLRSFECSPGSAVVLTTKVDRVVEGCSPSKTRVHSLVDFHLEKAKFLVGTRIYSASPDTSRQDLMKDILNICSPDAYFMKLFLQALYTNPDRTEHELKKLHTSIDQHRSYRLEMLYHLKRFCIDGLPERYKNCLWYSAVFTHKSIKTGRASLLRRWVAEGLLSKGEDAQRCFDVLCNQKLLFPYEVDCTDKVKSCALDPLVIGMLKEMTTEENFLDANQLPSALALNFSIGNGVKLLQLRQSNSMLKLLRSSSNFRLLRVLDLEGHKGFKRCHLKNICKIHQLRYLSLRNTDVPYLPKEIDQLQYLEALDIRGTRVQVFNAVLPKLKQLLAGRIVCASHEDAAKSKESSSAVHMPCGVEGMKLEVLSHVKVSNSIKELIKVGVKEKQLDLDSSMQKLRKLGVVVSGKNANLNALFLEIGELNICLKSLSIRLESQAKWDTAGDAKLPICLESLHISGITGKLPDWIKDLGSLTKITLSDTYLKVDSLAILGTLKRLVYLRLRYQSFDETTITFGDGQFSDLIELIIEDTKLTSIIFGSGTAPKLVKMLWNFRYMDSLLGVQNLQSMQRLELIRGKFRFDGLRDLQRDIPTTVCLSIYPLEDF